MNGEHRKFHLVRSRIKKKHKNSPASEFTGECVWFQITSANNIYFIGNLCGKSSILLLLLFFLLIFWGANSVWKITTFLFSHAQWAHHRIAKSFGYLPQSYSSFSVLGPTGRVTRYLFFFYLRMVLGEGGRLTLKWGYGWVVALRHGWNR